MIPLVRSRTVTVTDRSVRNSSKNRPSPGVLSSTSATAVGLWRTRIPILLPPEIGLGDGRRTEFTGGRLVDAHPPVAWTGEGVSGNRHSRPGPHPLGGQLVAADSAREDILVELAVRVDEHEIHRAQLLDELRRGRVQVSRVEALPQSGFHAPVAPAAPSARRRLTWRSS